jgi:hypothetical protein
MEQNIGLDKKHSRNILDLPLKVSGGNVLQLGWLVIMSLFYSPLKSI